MKKLYSLFFVIAGLQTIQSYALEGDTTVVTAHNGTELSWYDNYDQLATFPDGSLSYRKIMMEFELGKYQCDGYDPNNPGETSQGGTGWCADWDYDVHVVACTAAGDTLELGELITPYANSNFPRTPWAWKHAYWFDVTDFYPVLKNDVTIRIFYSGYSGGFTGTVKFHMIEGTRARDVVGITKLWHGGYKYASNSSAPIATTITPKTETFPSEAQSAEMKLIISGHGGDAAENCSEFCTKWYRFMVDGANVHQQDIWRDNCGSNFLYPQSGTWVYDRANWCPGDLVHTIIEKVPASVTPGSTYNVDMDFQDYTADAGDADAASYKISAIMFYYGAFTHQNDAGIEAIVSPTNDETYYRENPICGNPVIRVKNYGSDVITSMKFTYGVTGQAANTYTWSGSLASLAESEISLDAIEGLKTLTGSSNEFYVHIDEVNGSTDADTFNNDMSSEFTASPQWTGGNFRVDLKMNNTVQGYTNRVNWKISDLDGNVLFSRNGTQASTSSAPQIYTDNVLLPDGCYRLDVDATYLGGYGLNFFGLFSIKGYVRMFNNADGSQLALPKTDLGSAGLEGNFGNGFTQFFTVTNSTGVDDIDHQFGLQAYPNPANDELIVNISGHTGQEMHFALVNIVGQVKYAHSTRSNQLLINTQELPSGVYSLVCTSGKSRKVVKVTVAH